MLAGRNRRLHKGPKARDLAERTTQSCPLPPAHDFSSAGEAVPRLPSLPHHSCCCPQSHENASSMTAVGVALDGSGRCDCLRPPQQAGTVLMVMVMMVMVAAKVDPGASPGTGTSPWDLHFQVGVGFRPGGWKAHPARFLFVSSLDTRGDVACYLPPPPVLPTHSLASSPPGTAVLSPPSQCLDATFPADASAYGNVLAPTVALAVASLAGIEFCPRHLVTAFHSLA